ncbi:MAG: hypothetical protein H6705_16345 [Myxococcales bacterium]|nr:hypothetical protein [Myxococcales bacterium]
MKRWLGFAAGALVGCGGGGVKGGDADGRCEEDCPYADVAPSLGSVEALPVRGRIVEEDLPVDITDADPFKELAQDEIDHAAVALALRAGGETFTLEGVEADEEGYLDVSVPLPAGVPPGEHTLVLSVGGVVAGEVRAQLLAATHEDVVVRSDVDMTWLETDFMSASGLLELLEADARERRALPGMSAVYQALRAGASGAAARPVVFLSGSPRFFKRTIEGKMQLDGVVHAGLILKPFKDIVAANLLDFDVEQLQDELEEQIGYKLAALLHLRLDVPPGVPEILMGDDTEADVVVYVLYHRFTSGLLDAAQLGAELERLAVSAGWRDEIARLAPLVSAHLQGRDAPVRAIYINETAAPGARYPVADWQQGDLVRYHAGAWPLVLDLFEEGRVSAEGVRAVRSALEARGVDGAARAAAAGEAAFVEGATAAMFAE